jgi:apolipoprotein D and lipocalin family protein
MLIRHTLLVAVLLAATVATAQTTQPLAPLQSIAALDVPRYVGRWYEIA